MDQKESGWQAASPTPPLNGSTVAPLAAPVHADHGSPGSALLVQPAALVAAPAIGEHGGGLPHAGGTAAAMRAAKRWLLWRAEENPGKPKPKKVPYYAWGGRREGKLDTREDWDRLVTYEVAKERMESLAGAYTGLAFALGPDETGNCWQGVDLDNIRANQLSDLANTAPGLVEMSPSREGCHAVGYGRPFDSLGSNGSGVEASARGRYYTVTEDTIRDAPLQCIADFVELVLRPRHGSRPSNVDVHGLAEPSVRITPELVSDLRSALMHLRADDRDLWIAIGHALHELGDVGRGLWLDWSATWSEHRPGPDAKTWDTFEPVHTGYAAVFKHAQAAGWINPRSKDAQALPVQWPTEPFKPKPLLTFLGLVPVIEFLIDDMLRRGWLYTCTGQPGAGKTGVGVTVGLGVGTHGRVGKHQCNGGVVLYIASENPEDVNQRFKIAIERGGYAAEKLQDIHVLDQSFLLKDRLADLERIIDELNVVLVIVDTDQAVSLGGGTDENSNDARMAHAKNLRRLTRRKSRPTLLDLCHPNGTAGADALRPRGGSSMLAEIDGNIMLSRVEGTATFKSDAGKFRGEPFEIQFRSELVRSPSVVDTKGRQIAVPYFSPMDDSQAAFAEFAVYNDRQQLLKAMLNNPGTPQVGLLEQLNWRNADGSLNKPKISRLIGRMKGEDPPLIGPSGDLTATGKKLAKQFL